MITESTFGYITGAVIVPAAMAGAVKLSSLAFRSSSPMQRQVFSGASASTAASLFVHVCCCSNFGKAIRVVAFIGSVSAGSFAGHQATRIEVFKKHPEVKDDTNFTIATLKWAGIGLITGNIFAGIGTMLFGPTVGCAVGTLSAFTISSMGTGWEGGLINFPSEDN